MSCKIDGASSATGYWGNNPYQRIISEQIPEKILALLKDKLYSRGKDVYLWQQILENNPLALLCSCVKDTTDRADTTCASCYGTRYIPGYIRFAHETLYLASIDSGTTLVNVTLNTDIKSHRILLEDTSLTGSITSSAIAYDNSLNLNWDFRGDSATIKSTNVIDYFFSTDSITYYPISEINDTGKQPIGTGNIYLRVVLTRTSLADRSPEFEIIRIRHPNVIEPYIKILRPAININPTWGSYGKRSEHTGERFWTIPLNFFNSLITPNTTEAQIKENSFYERISGINTEIKYVTSKLMYNEEFGIFTQQSFDTRRTQEQEFYNFLVF